MHARPVPTALKHQKVLPPRQRHLGFVARIERYHSYRARTALGRTRVLNRHTSNRTCLARVHNVPRVQAHAQ